VILFPKENRVGRKYNKKMDTSSRSDAFCFALFSFNQPTAFPLGAQRALPTNSAQRTQKRLFVVLFSAILSLRNSNKLNMTIEREGKGDETKWTNPTWP
jgi:hypothetical protein